MGFMNKIESGVDKATDTISNSISVITTKKEFLTKQIMNFILLFVVLLVFGCLDFATLTFHPEYLIQPDYWGTVGTKVIAGVCAFNIGINFLIDDEIKKDGILKKAIEDYNELLTYKQIDFEYFVIHVFNRKAKKESYVSYINRKIYYLNKFSRARDRLLYSSELPENQEKKAKNRYCRRRAELEELKSEEYIEKNLDSLYVRYYEVDPAVFELEIDGSRKVKGLKTQGSLVVGRIKASSNVILGMVAFSMFVTAFGLEADKQEFVDNMVEFWHYCMKVCEDIGIVAWQFSQGMIRTRGIISSQLTIPYTNRNKILKEYIDWRLAEKKPNTLVYDELNSKQEIELTEEQLKRIAETTTFSE